MRWRKHEYKTAIEYSAKCGPVTFWINDDEGDFDTVIHYGNHIESAVLPNLYAAKVHCQNRAVALIQETLTLVQALENSVDWVPM